jgi:hypothetical protein
LTSANRLSVSYSYDLPFGKGQAHLADRGWVSALLTGWQTFGIVTVQTGRPFTVALLQEIDNSGTGRSTLGSARMIGRTCLGIQIFQTGLRNAGSIPRRLCFLRQVPSATPDEIYLDGPGYHAVNASLVKEHGAD